ncbi:hypothetical protein GCM10010964_01540 [Caldovatus sediminis]|uniref:DUF1194 domain-containing protein n=1 Tax=Caldovatus sediminis TaxID=2041189 RepID=A0A8J2Z7K2_9PROT|nr:DUF1194 domain-containing protein [Caldovatus sediminis]GGG16964.1 hypothetical protein GCM10010964_01540 [Caldovatus sediminis]
MRRRTLLASAAGFGAAAAAFPVVTGLGPAGPRAARAASRGAATPGDGHAPVDVNLVLAVDVSRSIDEDEARLQREGYRSAIASPQVVEAIRAGMLGAIGIAYVEWGGIEYQRTVLPWFRIASQEQAEEWAEMLARAPRVSLSWTSISGGIEHSRRLFAESPWEATRRVIDVSGDGVNNSGPPAEEARDRAVAEGITINGLPILNDRPTFGRLPPVPLDEYYRESVIGGPGAFVIPAEDFHSFAIAVKRKLIREIAGVGAPPGGPARPMSG